MEESVTRCRKLLAIIALTVLIAGSNGQEPVKEKAAVDKAARPDAGVVRNLIEQLRSPDFKIREKATQDLLRLDEVPDALREAVKSEDPEVRRRAQSILDRITKRLEEKAFQAIAKELHKLELDRLVRQMATDERSAGDKRWEIIQAVAKAVTRRARELGGQQLPVPEIDVKSLPLADLAREGADLQNKRVLLRTNERRFTSMRDCVVLCTGSTPRITGLTNSILLVDGDFTAATGIDNSLLIVRGNVGCVTVIRKSIVIATGNFLGATGCDDSFLQVNNQRIRFNGAERSVFIKPMIKTTRPTTSRVLDTEKGPLHLLRFSARKTDAQLAWGKEVKGLAVAITPADQKDKFLVRWKNVGKEPLEMPWMRFNFDVVDQYNDDLLDHVLLKGPDGKLVKARQYPPPKVGQSPSSLHAVVLGPGQTHEEIFDLWAYVERPAAPGLYRLTLELDTRDGRLGLDREVKSWKDKIQSNVLEITLGKMTP